MSPSVLRGLALVLACALALGAARPALAQDACRLALLRALDVKGYEGIRAGMVRKPHREIENRMVGASGARLPPG